MKPIIMPPITPRFRLELDAATVGLDDAFIVVVVVGETELVKEEVTALACELNVFFTIR